MRVIQHTVSCVVVLYDELTGRPVNSGTFEVRNQMGQQAVYKENGIYVFIGESSGEMVITIKGTGYQERNITVKIEDELFIQTIWMMPSIKHTALGRTTILTGTAAPHAEVKFILHQTELTYRLLTNLEQGDTHINLYHLPYDFILGREFRIGDISGKQFEDIIVMGEEQEGEVDGTNGFRLKRPAKLSHIAEKAKIHRISSVTADGAGEFFILFRDVPVSGCRCTIETEGKTLETNLTYKQTKRCEIKKAGEVDLSEE